MNEKVLESAKGNFSLYITTSERTTRQSERKYAISYLEVISEGIADKHVVEIRLTSADSPQVGSLHRRYTSNCATVSHGMRCASDSLEETQEYIEALTEALEFCSQINQFVRDNSYWRG